LEQLDTALEHDFGTGVQLGPQVREQLSGLAATAGSSLSRAVVNLGMGIPDLIARVFIFIGVLGALLPNYAGFVQWLKRLSPLDDRIDDIFLQKIRVTVWAMFLAIFVIAVVQGLVMGVIIWLAGVPYAALWTLLAIVTAMLPLGNSILALPLGGLQLLFGHYISGVVILAGYVLIVSNLDTFIRPRLVPEGVNLNFVLVLLSALGGYELFGFFGVVYGPVLMVMLLTALDVYAQYYTEPPLQEPPDATAQPNAVAQPEIVAQPSAAAQPGAAAQPNA
jgi:predicted PurR-regulated permease PerM